MASLLCSSIRTYIHTYIHLIVHSFVRPCVHPSVLPFFFGVQHFKPSDGRAKALLSPPLPPPPHFTPTPTPLSSELRTTMLWQVVGSALADPRIGGSSTCYKRVEEAVGQLRYLITATAPYGEHEAIPKALRPCDSMDDDMDLTAYEAEVFGDFQGTVQYNEEVAGQPTVADLCQIMTSTEEGQPRSPIDALAEVAQLFHNESGANCVCSSFQVRLPGRPRPSPQPDTSIPL